MGAPWVERLVPPLPVLVKVTAIAGSVKPTVHVKEMATPGALSIESVRTDFPAPLHTKVPTPSIH